MKKLFNCISLAAILFTGCAKPGPDKYVATAFINANMLSTFSSGYINSELVNPPQQYSDAGTGGMITIKRAALISQKITAAEEILKKINNLPEDAAADSMVEASKKLFETVIAAYKNECMELAVLYDNNAPQQRIEEKKEQIHTRYDAPVQELYEALGRHGMAYAGKHNVRVVNAQTAPGGK